MGKGILPLDLSVNFEESSNPSSFGTRMPLFPLESKGELTKVEGRAIPQSTKSLHEIFPYSLLYPGKKMSNTNHKFLLLWEVFLLPLTGHMFSPLQGKIQFIPECSHLGKCWLSLADALVPWRWWQTTESAGKKRSHKKGNVLPKVKCGPEIHEEHL